MSNKCRLDCEKLYCKQIKDSKILYDYVCKLLDKSEAKEELHEVEIIITQALEFMINKLVLDQVKKEIVG